MKHELKTALGILMREAQKDGQYQANESYSCVRKFEPTFPEHTDQQFVSEKLEEKFNGKIFGSARRTWTADSLRMKEVFYQLNYSTI